MEFSTLLLISSIPISLIAGTLLIAVKWQVGKNYGIDYKELNKNQKLLVKIGGTLLAIGVLLFFIGYLTLTGL